jgi:hypothetical protein
MTSPLRVPRPIRSTPEPRPDLRVVGAPVRRVRPGLILGASMIVVFVTLLSSAVAHSLLVSGQVHLDDVARQVTAEREALQQDHLRLATAQAPERIAREAAAIGMVPAGEPQWISSGSTSPVTTGGDAGTDGDPVEPTEPTGPVPPERGDPSQLALDGASSAGEPG